ncbi:MAG: hypothetical protein VX405_11315 [Myxococcota bacterium]|nr:hypothetical protein [Myxococcota bacterium]
MAEVRHHYRLPWPKLALGLTALMLGAYLASRFYGDDVERLGRWMLDHWGLGGILLLVVFIDTFTPGFPFETVLYFPMAAGEPWWWLAGLGGTASMLAGLCGYGLGRWLGQGLGVVERFQERPWFAPMRAQGPVWLAVAAVTPVPYCPVCWLAGAMGFSLRSCLVGMALRIPRTFIYLGLMSGAS